MDAGGSGLLRRERLKRGQAPVNTKRVYRVVKAEKLLLQRLTAGAFFSGGVNAVLKENSLSQRYRRRRSGGNRVIFPA